MKPKNFALIGAAGYIAPRHMKAIVETGNRLVCATDPHDSVGIIDSYSPEARFFTEIERFDRHMEKLRRGPEAGKVDYVSICTPNYLHDAHVRLALRCNAHAICEKPLIINPWNLDALEELEQEHQTSVYAVLQLRLHQAVKALYQRISNEENAKKHTIDLTYVTRRGSWYSSSWKNDETKSGGLLMNIGIHFFDMLLWIFGKCERNEVHLREPRKTAGFLELERARVRWFLSVDEDDLPEETRAAGRYAHRSLLLDGEPFDFSQGFTDLHTALYEEVLGGRGFGISDARPSVELVYNLRKGPMTPFNPTSAHPFLQRDSGVHV